LLRFSALTNTKKETIEWVLEVLVPTSKKDGNTLLGGDVEGEDNGELPEPELVKEGKRFGMVSDCDNVSLLGGEVESGDEGDDEGAECEWL
jgi:hypothetical protein